MTDWKPTAPLANLITRSRILATIRLFFSERQVLEVETPLLSQCSATDPHLDSFQVHNRYLHTSPEFPMKRLIAAGSGPIYQICKVFRQEEQGKRHNPEFTMLEWYRPGFSDQRLWQEAITLMSQVVGPHETNVISYREAFLRFLQVDPLTCELDTLKQLCQQHTGAKATDFSRDDCLSLLTATVVETNFHPDRFTVLSRFPASQAALAQKVPDVDGQMVSHRFEIFFAGMELANGYWELTDASEQQNRFQMDNEQRLELGKSSVPMDHFLLDALHYGMKDCAGIALGIDRLVMIACGTRDISDVLSFSWHNA